MGNPSESSVASLQKVNIVRNFMASQSDCWLSQLGVAAHLWGSMSRDDGQLEESEYHA